MGSLIPENVLGMIRAAAKIVSRLLNFKQKQRHMDIIEEMLLTLYDDPDMLRKVTTGDK